MSHPLRLSRAEEVFRLVREKFGLVGRLCTFVNNAKDGIRGERGKQEPFDGLALLKQLSLDLGGEPAVDDQFGARIAQAAKAGACRLEELAQADQKAHELHVIECGAIKQNYIWYSAGFFVEGQPDFVLQAEYYLALLAQNVVQAANIAAQVAQALSGYLQACADGRSKGGRAEALAAVPHAGSQVEDAHRWAALNCCDARAAAQELLGFRRALAILTEPEVLAPVANQSVDFCI